MSYEAPYPPQQQYGPAPGYPPRKNGMATASLVLGIVNALCLFVLFVPQVIGLVLGILGYQQTTRGPTVGRGPAIAGIILNGFWCLISVVGVLIWMASPGFLDTEIDDFEPGEVEEEPAADEGEAEDSHPGIGELVEHGDWEMTVTSYEEGVATGDLRAEFPEEPAGQWIVVEMTATNIASSPEYFEPSDQVLLDVDGSMYSYDILASHEVWDLDTVNPGNTVEGQIAFDVPEGVEISHMMVNGASAFEDGVRVDID
jgi:hypothetical protein